MEAESAVDEPEIEGEDGRVLKMLLGGRGLRRRKLRRLVLAHLLREGREGDEGEQGEMDEEGGEGGEERQIVRLLLGGRMLRRRKLRRMALAHLLRERAA